MTTRLLLVDGTNVVMRCASAQTDMPPDQVIATAGRMIRRAAEDPIHATHMVVAFDAFGPSFRHAIYPEYKAHRAGHAHETRDWAVAACTAFEADGVYCVAASGFEADDIIATLASRATANQHTAEIHILSSDSDLLALATAQVHCWQFGRKEEPRIVERTPRWICNKYGIESPAHLIDFKALVGEDGDNVPGVRGIGRVKARQLLAEYASIERMDAFGMLGGQSAWAATARQLITLRTDVPLSPIPPSACRVQRRSQAA